MKTHYLQGIPGWYLHKKITLCGRPITKKTTLAPNRAATCKICRLGRRELSYWDLGKRARRHTALLTR